MQHAQLIVSSVIYNSVRRVTVELSCRSMARALPFCKERDIRERSALMICYIPKGLGKIVFHYDPANHPPKLTE
jgi:hypothetical protein